MVINNYITIYTSFKTAIIVSILFTINHRTRPNIIVSAISIIGHHAIIVCGVSYQVVGDAIIMLLYIAATKQGIKKYVIVVNIISRPNTIPIFCVGVAFFIFSSRLSIDIKALIQV